MARKKKPTRSITEPVGVIDMKDMPSPIATEHKLDPREFGNWAPECRGDIVETVADLYRYLQRAREYLTEADRQLRIDELSTEELAEREAWYADMDTNDEWTGIDPDAHVACAQKIIQFFQLNPRLVERYDAKFFMLKNHNGVLDWRQLKITETLAVLREDVGALLARIAPTRTNH